MWGEQRFSDDYFIRKATIECCNTGSVGKQDNIAVGKQDDIADQYLLLENSAFCINKVGPQRICCDIFALVAGDGACAAQA